MLYDLTKKQFDHGFQGLPEDYPIPPQNDNSLFHIQRNQNKNTIVYELNRNLDGIPHYDYPMHVFWIKYNEGGVQQELNFIQNKLAYGYESKVIDDHTFEFSFVSYEPLKFYIGKDKIGKYCTFCNIESTMSVLKNIYVYAEEFGVFPNPKFIELYGTDINTGSKKYEKIIL